MTILRLFT